MKIKEFNIKTSKNKKYEDFLKECYRYAKKSNHPTTHVAAMLIKNNKIILKGSNSFPPGVLQKKERFQGENKHIYLNHAERDVIFKAAKNGISTKGLIMVMPWLPCVLCANAIISAGIKKLIVHKQMIEKTSEDWKNELKDALELLKEAKISISAYDGITGMKAYMHGEFWDS